MRIAIASVLLFLSAGSGLAQTRASGPWWPNPTWGAGDQAGASNWITPEKIVEAVRLVKTGKVYEIGQVYEKGMPLFGQRTFTMLSPEPPGIGLEVARWVAARKASMVGAISRERRSSRVPTQPRPTPCTRS